MARAQSRYVCQECGAAHPRWGGRCDACGGWNTIVEEEARESTPKGLGRAKGRKLAFSDLAGESAPLARHQTGIAELDRVFGGGLVPGSALLVSGDPGIGKSTLLLQAVAQLAKGGMQAAYISGEESVDQIRLRAARLELADAPVKLATATNIRDILTNLEPAGGPDVVVIDSIQTMFVDTLDSAPGTVAQLRTGAQELIRFAKRRGTILFLVGHVTKEGLIAGPRVLEHMVDTVLYFEGERGHQFRILRAIKNRFGPTDEIGVFEMTGKGLAEVPNPSALFLNTEHGPIAGAAVFAGIEGTRPVLVEIQALVASSALATPRRAVVGWDSARLAMLLAVLDARCGLALGANDVYLNVAGGLRISEPAADLAVAAALLSSLTDTPVPEKTVLFGEVGLAGEIRSVGQVAARLKEAAKLGFSHAFAPAEGREVPDLGIELCPLAELVDLVAIFERPDKRARGVS
ncbi:MAG: DNA repair protein RadA [Proteobacteria bacterium]|nr:DNA repair protein RadA [Pseudomonadota bacterium]